MLASPNIEFSERMFSARAIRSMISLLRFPEQFDLIWCGSLLTHIDERRRFPEHFDLIWCGSLLTHIDERRASDRLTAGVSA
jgi:hypothetical protein